MKVTSNLKPILNKIDNCYKSVVETMASNNPSQFEMNIINSFSQQALMIRTVIKTAEIEGPLSDYQYNTLVEAADSICQYSKEIEDLYL